MVLNQGGQASVKDRLRRQAAAGKRRRGGGNDWGAWLPSAYKLQLLSLIGRAEEHERGRMGENPSNPSPLLHQTCSLAHTQLTMAAEAPGAAFLQRRLARARAVPPAQRSPEVQAFITSVELGRQACELLPLEQSGQGSGEPQPGLPLDDPATTRRCGANQELTECASHSFASQHPCTNLCPPCSPPLVQGAARCAHCGASGPAVPAGSSV